MIVINFEIKLNKLINKFISYRKSTFLGGVCS